uniref:Uncharacterized protein n=1 Tax=Anopheles atroparvus TaxID=41427 RepID=A0A182JJJ5_ANOAO
MSTVRLRLFGCFLLHPFYVISLLLMLLLLLLEQIQWTEVLLPVTTPTATSSTLLRMRLIAAHTRPHAIVVDQRLLIDRAASVDEHRVALSSAGSETTAGGRHPDLKMIQVQLGWIL